MSLAEAVDSVSGQWADLPMDDLTAIAGELRQEGAGLQGAPAAGHVIEWLAAARETAARITGLRAHRSQLAGAAALIAGRIVELPTGEGKSLVAALAAPWLAGRWGSVHAVTANDYLAGRDASTFRRLYAALGVTAADLSGDSVAARRQAYGCDIVYGTIAQVGFDYLKDHLAHSPAQLMQRGHGCLLVDEADAVLIDEARTPLVISASGGTPSPLYIRFAAEVVPHLTEGTHWVHDERRGTVEPTDAGYARAEEILGVDNLFDDQAVEFAHHFDAALRAQVLFERDRDYVVVDNGIAIVDPATGRVSVGRRWSDGIHQALEAKEGVAVRPHAQTKAQITVSSLAGLYAFRAGLTATAMPAAREFAEVYGMDVVAIQPHVPSRRIDQPDQIYRTFDGKVAAAVREVKARHTAGQPVLLGVTSVASAERISAALSEAQIPHTVLSAKDHHREADIVAQAGRPGTVTVATSIAGRGVDIRLGGNADVMTRLDVKRLMKSAGEMSDRQYRLQAAKLTKEVRHVHAQMCDAQAVAVRNAGGLCVLGLERQDSRRVDDQLRGRAGRQGDPGESLFMVSLQDPVMRRSAAADQAAKIAARADLPADRPLAAGVADKVVARAQQHAESTAAGQRASVRAYEAVIDSQRSGWYRARQRILHADNDLVLQRMRTICKAAVVHVVETSDNLPVDAKRTWATLATTDDVDVLTGQAYDVWLNKVNQLGERAGAHARRCILEGLDRTWQDHLTTMAFVRDGIALRRIAQKDPLKEFEAEAHAAWPLLSGRAATLALKWAIGLPPQG